MNYGLSISSLLALTAVLAGCPSGSNGSDASTDAADSADEVPVDTGPVTYVSCATVLHMGPDAGACRVPNDSCAYNDCSQDNFGCSCGYDHRWTCGPQPQPPNCVDP